MSYTKGYKAFNKVEGEHKAGSCRDFVFEEGKTYKIDGELKLCDNGFHFCKDLVLTELYYELDTNVTIYAEVEAVGDIVYEEPNKHKCATSEIKIVKFLSDEEVNAMFDHQNNSGYYNSGDYNSGYLNSGDYNSGNRNSGNYNSGYYNSGNRNSGNCNSGDYNSGYYNSGNRNSGNRNSGNCNSGYYNSGNRNSGNYNSGNWNSCDKETGFFNTEQPKTVNVFNKPCDDNVWENAERPDFIYNLSGSGDYKDQWAEAFENATKEDCKLLIALPNFDYRVFEDLSGITQQMIEEKLKS